MNALRLTFEHGLGKSRIRVEAWSGDEVVDRAAHTLAGETFPHDLMSDRCSDALIVVAQIAFRRGVQLFVGGLAGTYEVPAARLPGGGNNGSN